MKPGALLRRAVLGLAAVSLAACSQPAPACPAKPTSGQIWVATLFNIEGIMQLDPQTGREFFDRPGSYMIEDWNVWPWTFASQPTASWASDAAFERTIESNSTELSGVKAVLYDPELWAATPANEQADLAGSAARFAATAHEHGFTAIVTPGLTLTEAPGASCRRRSGESSDNAYIRCDVAGQAAKSADMVEIQAQSLQGDPAAYRSIVGRAAAQARAANPGVKVISGLRVRDEASIADAERTWAQAGGVSDGFYLDMTPADATQFLQWISDCRTGP